MPSSITVVVPFTACGITGCFLKKNLTLLSWKDPAEKNLEATVDLKSNIGLSLHFSKGKAHCKGCWGGHGQLLSTQ